jgi:Protein of unknown function (DUF1353)
MRDKQSFMKVALSENKALKGEPAPIVPFLDWDYYFLLEKVEWRSDKNPSLSITAPRGFVTDLASVPNAFWSILPPTARYSYPAIIHDYLYWFQPVDRATADSILKQAMEDLRVSSWKIFTIYNGVRVGGGRSWSADANARLHGERRILKVFPSDINTTWESWRKTPGVFSDDNNAQT